MLKLKFLFAFLLIQSQVFAWAQQGQPTPSIPSVAKPASTFNSLPEAQNRYGRGDVEIKKESKIAGENNANGLVCSVFTSNFEWLTLSFVLSMHTTYMVEPSCDEDYYYQLTMASIEAQARIPSGSNKTLRGGAHAYTMDVNLSPVNNQFFYIGNLRFSTTGSVRISILDALKKKTWNVASVVDAPYTTYSLRSKMHYIWNIGTLAHRLVAPNGDTYIMYAFTNEVATGLTRDTLIDLKDQLSLPPGWRYENALLNQTVTVRPAPIHDFAAEVLFDELNNFYVKYRL